MRGGASGGSRLVDKAIDSTRPLWHAHRQCMLGTLDQVVEGTVASLIFVTQHCGEIPCCITHFLRLHRGVSRETSKRGWQGFDCPCRVRGKSAAAAGALHNLAVVQARKSRAGRSMSRERRGARRFCAALHPAWRGVVRRFLTCRTPERVVSIVGYRHALPAWKATTQQAWKPAPTMEGAPGVASRRSYQTYVPTAPPGNVTVAALPRNRMLNAWENWPLLSTIRTFLPPGALKATFGRP